MTEKKKTKKKAAPRRRQKPTKEELSGIEPIQKPEADDRTLSSRLGSGGRKYAEIFHLHLPSDNIKYHEIINNQDRYTVLETEFTWNKDKGSVIGLTFYLRYVDRDAEPE